MDKLLFRRILMIALSVLAVVYAAYLLISINFKMYPTENAVEQTNNPSHPLFAKKILFTGSLTMPRSEAEKKAEEFGAVISSSINKNLDYLIVGEKAGSKLAKAEQLGIQVLNEAQFVAFLALHGVETSLFE